MVSSQIRRLRFIRWSAVCGKTRMHGAERGKRRRQHQNLTYRYQKVATIRKYEISVTIIIQSLAQMQKMYEKDWQGIAGNCDTTIYLGGGTDTDSVPAAPEGAGLAAGAAEVPEAVSCLPEGTSATGATASILMVLMILRPLSLSVFVGLRSKTS